MNTPGMVWRPLLLLLLPLLVAAVPAHAAWLSRAVDGIMGTRIFVELWSEDDEASWTRCGTSMRP
jgi:hypothetical protein